MQPAFERAERVVIGICNPEPDLAAYDSADPHRSTDKANPLSFWERLCMIEAFLKEEKISHERYDIVPFPINFPRKIENYAPRDATYLLTIYDDWGRKKKQELESRGLRVVVLKEMSFEEKSESGTEIRDLIVENDGSWKLYVPQSVQNYLIQHNLLDKIK